MAKLFKKKETFSLAEPQAMNVQLMGNFTEWEKNPISLKRQKDGVWKATVPLEPGNHEYRFMVDGEWRNDPSCPTHARNPFGIENCVREVS